MKAIFRSACKAFCATVWIFCLLLTGCGAPASRQNETQVADPPAVTQAAETTQSTQPEETSSAQSDWFDASLVSFRQALVGTPQQFAAAWFGYAVPDGNVPVDPRAVMAGVAPQLCENLPFLLQIPEENVAGTEGNLFCIVPTDVEATVAVNWTPWDEDTQTYGDAIVLYRSERGDPFLLMSANTAWCVETEVIITDSQGNVTIWYPFIGDDSRIGPLCNDSGVSLYYDFSPYDRLNYEKLTGGAPMDMVGTWELTWTEVEGDRVESAPGGGTLEITTDGMGFFWISYRDANFPEDNFYDRELLVSAGEVYRDCGNNQWLADVYEVEDAPVRYALTVLEDGTLLMQYSWETEGMPMVSYGWYRRVS